MHSEDIFSSQVPVISFNESVFKKLSYYADVYNMSVYYFVKIIAVRFLSERTGISILELMRDEKAAKVMGMEYLNEEDTKTTVVGNGLTPLFWQTLDSIANVYEMEGIEFFHYIILRYLEDEENENLNSDLHKAFGLRAAGPVRTETANDSAEAESIDFDDVF